MIVVRIWEGLGNQMFQYAYARALQRHIDEPVFLEGRRIYRNSLPGEDLSVERKCSIYHYNLALKFIKPNYLSKWSYLERKNIIQKIQYWLAQRGIYHYQFITDDADKYTYREEFLEFHNDVYIMGHFFNRKYIEPIRDLLLQEFTLKRDMILSTELKEIMREKETVSIHIRRGDYLYAACAQTINREMNKGKYYERAIDYIREEVKNPFFLIFSDDIEWVKNNFPCPYGHIYVSDMGLKDYEEMALMAQCRHNIIANSTFSFWGAWLNQNTNKIVIAPKHWMPSIIPKEWIQI